MSKKKYNLNTIYISERLQENLKPISQSAFTAVTAPMGYGKTTAINWYLDKQSKNRSAYRWKHLKSLRSHKDFRYSDRTVHTPIWIPPVG